MPTRPLMVADRPCQHCGRVTEHLFELIEQRLDLVARCVICGTRLADLRPPKPVPQP